MTHERMIAGPRAEAPPEICHQRNEEYLRASDAVERYIHSRKY